MQQIFLVRHGETQWNAERRLQGQSNSPLTEQGQQQAKRVGERVAAYGITHIISSDLGRAKQTAEIIAEFTGCPVSTDPRLRELNMGVLETRKLAELTAEEEQWRHSLINGSPQGRIPGGETMAEAAERMHQALNACRELPAGSRVLLVSHGMALGTLINTLLGLPAWAERRIRLRNGSLSRVDYQQSPWLADGWIVETAGDVSHLSVSTQCDSQ